MNSYNIMLYEKKVPSDKILLSDKKIEFCQTNECSISTPLQLLLLLYNFHIMLSLWRSRHGCCFQSMHNGWT